MVVDHFVKPIPKFAMCIAQGSSQSPRL